MDNTMETIQTEQVSQNRQEKAGLTLVVVRGVGEVALMVLRFLQEIIW